MNQSDKEKIEALIKKADKLTSSLVIMPDAYRKAITILNKALRIDPDNIDILTRWASAERQEAIAIRNEGLKIDPENLGLNWAKNKTSEDIVAYGELHDNRDVLLERMKGTESGWWIKYASKELRNDRELILTAVKQPNSGQSLQYASPRLRNDREVVFTAVQNSGLAIQYATEELRNNKEIVLEALKADFGASIYHKDEGVFQYVSKALRNNREVILEAVQHGSTLSIVSPIFQNDAEIVHIAVNGSGLLLKYASPGLRSNREIVFAAVRQNGNAIVYASPSFDDDKELVIMALSHIPMIAVGLADAPGNFDVILGCTTRRLREDFDVIKAIFGIIPADMYYHDVSVIAARTSRMYGGDVDYTLRITNMYCGDDYGDDYSVAAKKYVDPFSNFFQWGKLSELKEKREENWQRMYGAIQKDRLERWRSDLEQWQKNKKNYEYDYYKAWRVELEHMPKYQSWKRDVFTKCGKRCEICGKTENLEIHHRKSLHLIWQQEDIKDIYQAFECDRLWDVDNGSVLCHECHERMESSKQHKNLSMN